MEDSGNESAFREGYFHRNEESRYVLRRCHELVQFYYSCSKGVYPIVMIAMKPCDERKRVNGRQGGRKQEF
jgi:hypothetical protein